MLFLPARKFSVYFKADMEQAAKMYRIKLYNDINFFLLFWNNSELIIVV